MRLRLLNEIVESKYSEYVDKAIAEVKSLGPQSGDERYKNVWEEFAAQIQVQHSVFFDAYEDTIRRICLGIVEHLPEAEIRLLWLWTDAFLESEHGTTPCLQDMVYNVFEEVYSRVCGRAADEELPEEDDQLADSFFCDDEVLSALQELTAFVEGLVIPSKMTALTIQGIAQLLVFLRRLPAVTRGVSGTLTIGVSKPETRYYSISAEEGYVELSDGGAVYDPAVGSDSYSSDCFVMTRNGVDQGGFMDISEWVDGARMLLNAGAVVTVEGFESIDDIDWDEDGIATNEHRR